MRYLICVEGREENPAFEDGDEYDLFGVSPLSEKNHHLASYSQTTIFS